LIFIKRNYLSKVHVGNVNEKACGKLDLFITA